MDSYVCRWEEIVLEGGCSELFVIEIVVVFFVEGWLNQEFI